MVPRVATLRCCYSTEVLGARASHTVRDWRASRQIIQLKFKRQFLRLPAPADARGVSESPPGLVEIAIRAVYTPRARLAGHESLECRR